LRAMPPVERHAIDADAADRAERIGTSLPAAALRLVAFDRQRRRIALRHQRRPPYAWPRARRDLDLERVVAACPGGVAATQPPQPVLVQPPGVAGTVPDLAIDPELVLGVAEAVEIALVDVVAGHRDLVVADAQADAVDRPAGEQSLAVAHRLPL